MPFIILLAVMIGGGTTFAAQGAVPGDFLYPVKTQFNENVRAALAVSADSEAKLQTDLLEERVVEAQKLRAQGKFTAETSQSVSSAIVAQVKVATKAAEKSSAVLSANLKSQIKIAVANYLNTNNLDTALATEVSASLTASELATGEYDIATYQASTKTRTEALAGILQKYQSDLDAKVYVELSAKVEAATELMVEAQTKIEAEARLALDKAAALATEVESKLSTLGQAEVDSSSGVITDINFSVDPMIIDRGEGNVDASATSGTDVQINGSNKGAVDSGVLNTNIEGETSVRGSGSINL